MQSVANQNLLLGMQTQCQVCNVSTPDPSLCANCGKYGHPVCIGVEYFQGYAFCRSCMSQVILGYAQMSDATHREQWQISLATQVASWRERARTAIGASASIGITVGGVAATAAGAAYAVAQGLVQGASSAHSGTQLEGSWEMPAVTVPPPPENPGFVRPRSLRRSNSEGDLLPSLEQCPKCDLGRKREPHTYRGTCRGLPASFYFRSRGTRLDNQTPAEEPVLSRPSDEDQDVVMEPSPDERLDALLEQRRAVPPSSFGSANSNTHQSFHGTRTEALPGHPSPMAPVPQITGATGSGDPMTLEQQLRAVISSNEELSRAVADLQVSVSNLEIQVSDLQLQMQYYDLNPVDVSPRHYDLTPRLGDATGQPDRLDDWYNNQLSQVPRQEQDLRQPPGERSSTAEGTGTNQPGNASDQPADQGQSGFRTSATSDPFTAIAVQSGPHVTEISGEGTQVPLPTDSDVFSFLAGEVSSPTGATPVGSAQPPAPSPVTFTTPSLPMLGDRVTAPPGLGSGTAQTAAPTQQELGMILKAIQTFLIELPKIELADVATRATRLLAWKSAVGQALIPTGMQVCAWWKWCVAEASSTHKKFLAASLATRESIVPASIMPDAWAQIDAWLRPKLLEAIPAVIRDWVAMRGRQNKVDQTHVILFWVMKQFGPGSAEEHVTIESNIRNPHVCTQPRAAQVELMRWKENVRRLAELNISPPSLLLTYRAMESIFSIVFDKAEPQLNARWIGLKNQLGLPHHVDKQAIEKVAAFADAELGALVLAGNNNLNPGLPLTDNQKARLQQIRESDKKRAAAAKQKPGPSETSPKASPPETAAAMIRKSATTSMWAPACNNWTNTGTCSRGISCHFAHAGFPISEKRCITCGKSDHTSKDCKAPGGQKDPKRDEVWAEYRKRKEQNAPAKGETKGKGKGGAKGKGKGQSKGKKGDKDDTKPNARAAIDMNMALVASAQSQPVFPRECIGLDSWANVHLIHQRPRRGLKFPDTLHLAHGSCKCRRDIGPKGVPRVYVPFQADGDNIDLFPEGFLYERGCEIMRGATHTITTPKGRSIPLLMWGSLPYLTKEDLQKGHSGSPRA